MFISSTILMSTYSILQFFKLDPINWNSEIYFGTFGNINFLSAFLGLGSIVGISKLFSLNLNLYFRLLLIFLILTNAFLIINSRSIQGLVIFLVGTTVVIFLYLLSKDSKSIVIKLYVTSLLLISFLLAIAIFNIGPLSKYLYDSNVQFRQDYWSAGLSMTRNYPISGIGLDSYGDWYRQFRDPSSSIGDNFNRVSTSAHSIFLDLSSGGGLPLLIAYLLINLFAMFRAIKYLKKSKEFNWVFASVLSTYTGYQVYSLVSINNIGIAVWGWSLTGLLIGFSDKSTSSSHNSSVNVRSSRIGLTYRTLFSLVLIYLIAYTPFQSDMRFRTAFETAGSQEIIIESQLNGNTSIHREAALMIFTRRGDVNSAHSTALDIVDRFPRNYLAWKYLSDSPLSEDSLRSKALDNIDKLEPNLRN
jgi:hypothetical protein